MSTPVRLAAFLVAVAAASAATIWNASGASSSDEQKVTVCIGKDRILRELEAGAKSCPPGERALELSRWKEEKPDVPEAEQETSEIPAKKAKSDEPAITHRVTAPFEVVDKAGTVIFRVTEDDANRARGAYVERDGEQQIGLGVPDSGPWVLVTEKDGATPAMFFGMREEGPKIELYHSGQSAVDLGSAVLGGYLSLDNPDGSTPGALLHANGGKGGQLLLFDTKGDGVIDLGPGTASNPALRFYTEKTNVAAAIGIDKKGQGAVRIAKNNQVAVDMTATPEGGSVTAYHGSGQPAATMSGRAGIGIVQISGEDGEVLGSLIQGKHGGLLQLNSLAGEPMVEAGNNGSEGVVRAGPMSRGTTAIPGLPGSYIIGKR